MDIYLLIILIGVASVVVSKVLDSKFDKYSGIRMSRGMTGAQVAKYMLESNGVYDVAVEDVNGKLTDHYDPSSKVVRLSEGVYESDSIAAAAVAAHECGHALQHAQGYAPLKLRTALVPVVNFSNKLVSWVLLAGILFVGVVGPSAFMPAAILFGISALFSFVTLPVEINASRRAIAWLDNAGLADSETLPMAKDALKWAAYTYVVAALGSLITFLYYLGAARSRK